MRKTRKQLTEYLCAADSSLSEDMLIVPVDFNLSLTHGTEKTEGAVAFCKTEIRIYEKSNLIAVYPMSEVKEFIFRTGIGCVSLECRREDGDILLCRADMTFSRLYAAVASRLNHVLSGGSYSFDYENELESSCPKCGRPYPPGVQICYHCTDKKGYLKRIWQIAKRYRGQIFLSVLLYFTVAGANLIGPALNRILVDDYIKAETQPVLRKFLIVILQIFLLNLFIHIVSIIRSRLLNKAGSSLIVDLREMVFRKIELLSISRVSKRTSGELMNRVTNDTATLQDFITNDIGDAVEQALIFLGIGIFLFAYDWQLALLILCPVPVVMFANRVFWKYMNKRYHRQWTLEARASSVLHDIFSGIRVVKAFGMEKKEYERYDESITELRDTSIRNERMWNLFLPPLQFLMGIGEFFLLYYVGSKILQGEMTLGYMQQISSYISMIYGPLFWLANMPRRFIRVMTSVVKIFDVIDEKVDVADKPNARVMKIRGDIEFDNVSFGYEESVPVLKHISFSVHPGEMIGIVGRSGVGKSTLINLIMRLYDANEGSIRIDGVDIRDISQDSLRSQTGVVLQETFLFSGTVYDNIAYAKPSATREEVITAAKLAGAHSFIMKLPDAYNTKIGERGFTLSGGERQRLAIARAVLHDTRILILDEATASLDTETEKQIQDALLHLTKNRTTFAIAHRLSTLRNATRLIVLDKGTIAESGTHEELIRKKGIYYDLVMAQRQMSKLSSTKSA